MLNSLRIKNFALIKELELKFENGFNLLLGETGSGKSIILDALNFALGEKSNKNFLRTGENSLRVDAQFSGYGELTKLALTELGIEDEGILILSRTLSNSSSEIRINGSPATLSMLKIITETLVDCYGQHENQVLLKQKNHLIILDSFSGESVRKLKEQISAKLTELKLIKTQINGIGGTAEERTRTLDLLSYQIDEIESMKLKVGEDEEIENKLLAISNAEKISSSIELALNNLDGSNNSTLRTLQDSIKSLNIANKYVSSLDSNIERLNNSLFEVQDIVNDLIIVRENSSFNQNEFEELDSRLDKIKLLKKKYGNSIPEILKFLGNAKQEKERFLNADELLAKLTKQESGIKKDLYKLSTDLTAERKKYAKKLEDNLIKELADLGMRHARFEVNFKSYSDDFENLPFAKDGLDNVEFMFSANLGESLKSLCKTISGGEMSRFMLGFKNILADKDGVATLVFDEIDTGISGNIGSKVAEKLSRLSKNYQVLCISHLPQVCSMADKFFYVSKASADNQTYTSVENLNEKRIVEQIACLSGGNSSSQVALEHAKALLEWARDFKKAL